MEMESTRTEAKLARSSARRMSVRREWTAPGCTAVLRSMRIEEKVAQGSPADRMSAKPEWTALYCTAT